ncbi:alpha/beta fold hydrolase [Bradyrhizobium sp. Cp5.3]|uniref:alpha/beta fold hydrolase n=1 Tax=Bradyrhizobium sp. Cp5.3 TaxID=443598 RepID=UPI00041FBE39|nr:alpha/beta hydrolase [Bradyrhizobium sp. Cp5.3]
MLVPQSRYYESHGLRLHYADWGNEGAPIVILVHGGRDHCRSWDVIARSLQPHFHVLAPDLRGHGDSDWTRGGSYALTEYVYDLAQLVRTIAAPQVILIGHSMGGMVSLIYSGSFPEQVSSLVVLDGVTVLPDAPKAPTHERITKWIGQLDKLHDRAPRRYRSIEDAAAQMITYNKRLSRELALHLATHGTRQNEDGTYSWKFDPYQRTSAPHRLWSDDHVALWARIACPTLLLNAGESFLAGTKAAGLERYLQRARIEAIAGAGHWLQHDRPAEVISAIRRFLGLAENGGG